MKTCIYFFTMAISSLALFSCGSNPKYPDVQPPVARQVPHEIVSKNGQVRVDNYFWLKNREDTAVIQYLTSENHYLDTMMAHTRSLQDSLFKEMRHRIKETDESVPVKIDDYFYYTRFVEGAEYPVYCRKQGSIENPEEVLVDGNILGKGKSYFNFYIRVSPDHQKAAVMMDTVGRNFYTIQIKDLKSGEFLTDVVEKTRGGVEWTNDNSSILYSLPDPVTLRNYVIKRHLLGSPFHQDQIIFEEKDETLSCNVGKTKSKKFFIISSGRTDANYCSYVDATKPGKPILVNPLAPNVEYSVDHAFGDKFFIYTNLNARNYRLVEAPISKPSAENWKDIISERKDVFLKGVDYFAQFLALDETEAGLTQIRLIRWNDKSEHSIDFGEAAYSAGIGYNPELNTDIVRYTYQSMTTPSSVFDYNMVSKEKKLMKEQEVPGGFNKENYETARIMVKSRDGKEIPLSIVYHKKHFSKNGKAPGLIYGYGSYGYSMNPTFSTARLSLLDRGFVYAIAHIRGGQEMGGDWYEDGKMLNKINTFNDFIDCSEWLIQNKYIAPDKLFAYGGSAGGLLMGAIANMRPDLYRGIIAAVPFVDVVTTMMDESIPLTTFEWLEWGNPGIKEQYDYMLSYSPYDNVKAMSYPNMLVLTGLHDSQVQYWEPAKWVAKLRALKTDKNLLLLHTNMEAGHGGATGRFKSLKEVALQYAFMFDILGIKE